MLEQLRWKIQRFMQGRNGVDELNKVIFCASFAVYLLAAFFQLSLMYYLWMIGFGFFLYRTFSRKLAARQEENRIFLRFFRVNRLRFEQRKEYRIFTCKGCGRNIRVPKGKGKIEVTCPACGYKKIHRT